MEIVDKNFQNITLKSHLNTSQVDIKPISVINILQIFPKDIADSKAFTETENLSFLEVFYKTDQMNQNKFPLQHY